MSEGGAAVNFNPFDVITAIKDKDKRKEWRDAAKADMDKENMGFILDGADKISEVIGGSLFWSYKFVGKRKNNIQGFRENTRYASLTRKVDELTRFDAKSILTGDAANIIIPIYPQLLGELGKDRDTRLQGNAFLDLNLSEFAFDPGLETNPGERIGQALYLELQALIKAAADDPEKMKEIDKLLMSKAVAWLTKQFERKGLKFDPKHKFCIVLLRALLSVLYDLYDVGNLILNTRSKNGTSMFNMFGKPVVKTGDGNIVNGFDLQAPYQYLGKEMSTDIQERLKLLREKAGAYDPTSSKVNLGKFKIDVSDLQDPQRQREIRNALGYTDPSNPSTFDPKKAIEMGLIYIPQVNEDGQQIRPIDTPPEAVSRRYFNEYFLQDWLKPIWNAADSGLLAEFGPFEDGYLYPDCGGSLGKRERAWAIIIYLYQEVFLRQVAGEDLRKKIVDAMGVTEQRRIQLESDQVEVGEDVAKYTFEGHLDLVPLVTPKQAQAMQDLHIRALTYPWDKEKLKADNKKPQKSAVEYFLDDKLFDAKKFAESLDKISGHMELLRSAMDAFDVNSARRAKILAEYERIGRILQLQLVQALGNAPDFETKFEFEGNEEGELALKDWTTRWFQVYRREPNEKGAWACAQPGPRDANAERELIEELLKLPIGGGLGMATSLSPQQIQLVMAIPGVKDAFNDRNTNYETQAAGQNVHLAEAQQFLDDTQGQYRVMPNNLADLQTLRQDLFPHEQRVSADKVYQENLGINSRGSGDAYKVFSWLAYADADAANARNFRRGLDSGWRNLQRKFPNYNQINNLEKSLQRRQEQIDKRLWELVSAQIDQVISDLGVKLRIGGRTPLTEVTQEMVDAAAQIMQTYPALFQTGMYANLNGNGLALLQNGTRQNLIIVSDDEFKANNRGRKQQQDGQSDQDNNAAADDATDQPLAPVPPETTDTVGYQANLVSLDAQLDEIEAIGSLEDILSRMEDIRSSLDGTNLYAPREIQEIKNLLNSLKQTDTSIVSAELLYEDLNFLIVEALAERIVRIQNQPDHLLPLLTALTFIKTALYLAIENENLPDEVKEDLENIVFAVDTQIGAVYERLQDLDSGDDDDPAAAPPPGDNDPSGSSGGDDTGDADSDDSNDDESEAADTGAESPADYSELATSLQKLSVQINRNDLLNLGFEYYKDPESQNILIGLMKDLDRVLGGFSPATTDQQSLLIGLQNLTNLVTDLNTNFKRTSLPEVLGEKLDAAVCIPMQQVIDRWSDSIQQNNLGLDPQVKEALNKLKEKLIVDSVEYDAESADSAGAEGAETVAEVTEEGSVEAVQAPEYVALEGWQPQGIEQSIASIEQIAPALEQIRSSLLQQRLKMLRDDELDINLVVPKLAKLSQVFERPRNKEMVDIQGKIREFLNQGDSNRASMDLNTIINAFTRCYPTFSPEQKAATQEITQMLARVTLQKFSDLFDSQDMQAKLLTWDASLYLNVNESSVDASTPKGMALLTFLESQNLDSELARTGTVYLNLESTFKEQPGKFNLANAMFIQSPYNRSELGSVESPAYFGLDLPRLDFSVDNDLKSGRPDFTEGRYLVRVVTGKEGAYLNLVTGFPHNSKLNVWDPPAYRSAKSRFIIPIQLERVESIKDMLADPSAGPELVESLMQQFYGRPVTGGGDALKGDNGALSGVGVIPPVTSIIPVGIEVRTSAEQSLENAEPETSAQESLSDKVKAFKRELLTRSSSMKWKELLEESQLKLPEDLIANPVQLIVDMVNILTDTDPFVGFLDMNADSISKYCELIIAGLNSEDPVIRESSKKLFVGFQGDWQLMRNGLAKLLEDIPEGADYKASLQKVIDSIDKMSNQYANLETSVAQQESLENQEKKKRIDSLKRRLTGQNRKRRYEYIVKSLSLNKDLQINPITALEDITMLLANGVGSSTEVSLDSHLKALESYWDQVNGQLDSGGEKYFALVARSRYMWQRIVMPVITGLVAEANDKDKRRLGQLRSKISRALQSQARAQEEIVNSPTEQIESLNSVARSMHKLSLQGLQSYLSYGEENSIRAGRMDRGFDAIMRETGLNNLVPPQTGVMGLGLYAPFIEISQLAKQVAAGGDIVQFAYFIHKQSIFPQMARAIQGFSIDAANGNRLKVIIDLINAMYSRIATAIQDAPKIDNKTKSQLRKHILDNYTNYFHYINTQLDEAMRRGKQQPQKQEVKPTPATDNSDAVDGTIVDEPASKVPGMGESVPDDAPAIEGEFTEAGTELEAKTEDFSELRQQLGTWGVRWQKLIGVHNIPLLEGMKGLDPFTLLSQLLSKIEGNDVTGVEASIKELSEYLQRFDSLLSSRRNLLYVRLHITLESEWEQITTKVKELENVLDGKVASSIQVLQKNLESLSDSYFKQSVLLEASDADLSPLSEGEILDSNDQSGESRVSKLVSAIGRYQGEFREYAVSVHNQIGNAREVGLQTDTLQTIFSQVTDQILEAIPGESDDLLTQWLKNLNEKLQQLYLELEDLKSPSLNRIIYGAIFDSDNGNGMAPDILAYKNSVSNIDPELKGAIENFMHFGDSIKTDSF